MGIGTGIGAATGIAGIALQGYQTAQVNKQLPEQEELLKLQKKLTQYQLKQYEEQEKADKHKQEIEMFKTPANIGANIGMATRAMTQNANVQRSISNANLLSNSGLGAIQRGNIIGTGAPVAIRNPGYTPYSSTESLSLLDRGPRMNLTGSTTTLGSLNRGSRGGSVQV